MIPIILSAKPARIISGIENLFAPKTIAFGGVATGSMKAQLAARTTGMVRETGSTPIDTATAPTTGKNVLVVATLDVISVRKKNISIYNRNSIFVCYNVATPSSWSKRTNWSYS